MFLTCLTQSDLKHAQVRLGEIQICAIKSNATFFDHCCYQCLGLFLPMDFLSGLLRYNWTFLGVGLGLFIHVGYTKYNTASYCSLLCT